MRQFSARLLRDTRRQSGLSREQAAVRAGISFAALTKYEQGTQIPGANAAARVADALGVTVDALLETAGAVGAAA